MFKLLFGLGSVAIIAVVLFVAVDPSYQDMRQNRAFYERQQQSIDLQRRELELEERQQLSALYTGTKGSMQIIGVVAVLAVLVAAADWYYNRRVPLVRPDARGLLPVGRHELASGQLHQLVYEAVVRYHKTQALQAVHQPGQTPASLHYSPRNDYRLPEQPSAESAALASVAVPAFSELLGSGRVGRGQPLLLAYDMEAGKPLEGSWLDLYSTAIAGLPGTGKTTSQRFYACQTALHGAKFAVVDPHAEAGEDSLAATLDPLRGAFICEPASDDKAILNTVKLVASIGARRARQGDRDRTPVIIWIDELTALLARSTVRDALAELIEQIAQEYRKVAVYATASGQIWTASRTGDSSALRDSFASALVHRMKRGQARLLLPAEDAQRVERLEPGRAVLWRTSGASTLVAVPNTTAADVQRVADLLNNPAMNPGDKAMNWGENTRDIQPEFSPNSARNHPGRSASGRQTPEAARIIELFIGGMDAGEIVTTLTGMKSNRGYPYQTKLREVQAVIRVALRGPEMVQ